MHRLQPAPPVPDLHRQSPLCFRPDKDDRAWLAEHARATGRSVYKVLADALTEYRRRHEDGPPAIPGVAGLPESHSHDK